MSWPGFLKVVGSLFWLRVHVGIALTLVIALFTLKPFPVESALYFWIPFCIGLPAALHFFGYSTLTVSDDWVDERVFDLRTKSYDFDHINNITRRHTHGDPTATNPEELKRKERDND